VLEPREQLACLQSGGPRAFLSGDPFVGTESMDHPPSEAVPEIVEQLHAHNLQLILRTAHSFLAYHAPHIKRGKSLRILDLALLSAIADLQESGASPADDGPPV